MAWKIKTDLIESCSCAALCPCVLGPAKPDQGWCSGVFGFTIGEGSDSDGVDLSGVSMVLHFELPGDFLGGIDKGILYVDEGASEAQRTEIDAIFHGEKGGLWGGMKEAIKEWLPTKVVKVNVAHGDAPSVTVEGIGEIQAQPIQLEDGTKTTITAAPVLAAFNMKSAVLAYGNGTKFSDPDLRSWESLGEATLASVEWSA